MTTQLDCCICHKPIPTVDGWPGGNNPFPVSSKGRCCHDCDWLYVLPTRLNLKPGSLGTYDQHREATQKAREQLAAWKNRT